MSLSRRVPAALLILLGACDIFAGDVFDESSLPASLSVVSVNPTERLEPGQALHLAGTCGPEASTITLYLESGAVAGATTCSGGAWTLDLAQLDGLCGDRVLDLLETNAAKTPLSDTALNLTQKPLVSFAAATASVTEAAGSLSYQVGLSTACANTVSVDSAIDLTNSTATGAGVDYIFTPGTLTFAPGETSRTLSLGIVDDTLPESSETISIILKNFNGVVAGTFSTLTISIADNDVADAAHSTISVDGPHLADLSDAATFTVTLRDSGNRPLAGLTPVLAATGNGNTLNQTCPATNALGVSVCANALKTNTDGTKTVSLDSPDLPSVSVGAIFYPYGPDHFVYISGDNQTGPAGSLLPVLLKVQVVDALGNPFASPVIVALEQTLGFDSRFVTPLTPLFSTDAEGVAEFSVRLGYSSNLNLFRIVPVGIVFADAANTGATSVAFSEHVTTSALATGTFQAQVTYPTDNSPYGVTTGDFNGDHKLDLAVVNESGSVSILLGVGDGTFQTKVDYLTAPPASSPFSIAITTADFDGDGKLDLAVANNNTSDVAVLIGVGDGTFLSATNYPVGPYPQSIATGDVNGDGAPDLVVGNNGNGTFTVLMGDGSGAFAAAGTDIYAGGNVWSVALGDFNNDGKLDVVVVGLNTTKVSLHLGNGDGTFQAQRLFSINAGAFARSVVVGDFDGDGKPDLAVGSTSNTVDVFLGNGDGTLQSPQSFSTGSDSAYFLSTGDFNGDGKLDLALAEYNTFKAAVMRGNGDGTFQAKSEYSVFPYPSCIAVGDFNGDGKLDMGVPVSALTALSILIGN